MQIGTNPESKEQATAEELPAEHGRAQPEVEHVAGPHSVSNAPPAAAQEPPAKASEGEGDYSEQWAHIPHKVLIRRTAQYCVVISPEIRLDWGTSSAYDESKKLLSAEDKKSHSDILADIAVAESSPCDDFPESVQIRYRILLGEAIVLCFEGEYVSAKRTIESARQYMQARNEETSRRWYVMACAKAACGFFVIAVLVWIFRETARSVAGPTVFWLLLSCCGGAVGAMFSVIARSGKLQFDASAGKDLHVIEGTSRIVAGAISGLVVAMAVRSDIVFGVFANGEHLTMVSMLAAIAGGSGERLATSIISKFDETQVRDDKHAPS
ncbi:hypothetical protein SAMN02745746_01198 [Pseudogulbenkiania subflava DSM 22618]|uniref:Uncharacterized protein n=2 Tax=Pseudogulbenkiania subflava TaxID=451637 RepID=A0A1Y6BI18_9NEIS|nr:hypothetical protein SAMN02745746_01198 [Pseudogulbenkiania subflava DSM 22618]